MSTQVCGPWQMSRLFIYNVKFAHGEHYTEVEFSALYASDVRDAQDKAEAHLLHANEWVCISVERVD